MGYFGDDTQATTIPDASPEETAMLQLATDGLMTNYLEQSGVSVLKETKAANETDEYKRFQTKIADLEARKAEVVNEGSTDPRDSRLRIINSQIQDAYNRQQTFVDNYKPQISYKTYDTSTPELKNLYETYGGDSDQYKAGLTTYREGEQAKLETADKIQTQFNDVTMKFLNGDFSITPEQKALIQNNMAPVRSAVEKMFTDVTAEAEKTGKSLNDIFSKTFADFETQVKQTNMDVTAALDAVGSQIKETGADMEGALTNVISTNKELMKMGIEDYTGKITKQVSMQAAMSGRSPDDPEYSNEIQMNVARQVKEGTLNLAAMEAQGMLGIKERTGGQLEQMLLQKASLAESTGGKLEQAKLSRGEAEAKVAERTGGIRENAAATRGTQNIGIEEGIANQAWNIGAGMPPSQVATGQSTGQFGNAVAQQKIQNAAAAMTATTPFLSYYQGERMAQPTTTTSRGFGVGDAISSGLGMVSAGASIYSGVGSMNALNKIAAKLG